MKRAAAATLALLSTFASAQTAADEHERDQTGTLEVRSFGSASFAASTSRELLSKANMRQSFGAGPEGSFATDSKAGVQIDWRPIKEASATAMAYCERSSEGCPRIMWAYAKFDPSEELSFRLGRFRLAPFLGSEAQEVGHLTLWPRNPVEIYSIYAADDLAGASVERSWSTASGGDVRASFSAGQMSGKEIGDLGPYTVDVVGGKLRGSSASFDWVASLNAYRLSYSQSSDATLLVAAANASGDRALADDYSAPAAGLLASAGAHWSSPGDKLILQAEAGYRSSDKLNIQKMASGYFLAGTRQGQNTFYAMRGFARSLNPSTEARGGALQPFFQQALDQSNWSHDSFAIGAKRNLAKNWSLKGELSWHKSSGGTDNTVRSNSYSTPAGDYTQAIFSLDFLF